MKKFITSAMVIFLVYSLNATAGLDLSVGSTTEVYVEADGSGAAFGNLYGARASENDLEYIRCGVKWTETGLHPRSFCAAGDANGLEIGCSIQSEVLAQALNAMTAYSYIGFWVTADGVCQRIDISNNSWNIPASIVTKPDVVKEKK